MSSSRKNLLSRLQEYTQALPPMSENEHQSKKDGFMKRLWPTDVTLDFKNPFVSLSLDSNVLSVVNAYMQMWTTLRYYDLSKTVPVTPGDQAQYSQNWHRDPEEKRLMKMFIYLTDVDEESGPFIYIPESVHGLRLGGLFPQRSPAGSYPLDEEVDRAIPVKDRRTMIGKAGTIMFCDTSGLHKGGYARLRPRIMFTASFTAPSSCQEFWYREAGTLPETLSPEARFALRPRLASARP